MYEEFKEHFERLTTKEPFQPGDMVGWKKGLQNKRSVGPFIVVEVLPEPVYDRNNQDSGSPYFREPLDIVAGKFDADGDFVCYYYDSRRLTKIE